MRRAIPLLALALTPTNAVGSAPTAEGAGEPQDRLFFHAEEDLLLFAARADAEPVIRIEGCGRSALHGRWSELTAADGDGRARA